MNIIKYAQTNGIYDFRMKSFCDVDSLVISQLVYLKFENIIPGIGIKKNGVRLCDIIKHPKYETIYRDERYKSINREFFEALCNSRRYKNLILNNFIDIIDEKEDVQFCAMTVHEAKGFNYIVFRGTDDSIVGWKEDLNMTFKTPVPAQEYSVKYLEKTAGIIKGDFYVGGHSKGGNLAVYSSMNCNEDVRARIINIFSHDGPGFRTDLLINSCYDEIKDRIKKFVPKSAVVGLFGNVEKFEVVDCEKMGVKQHNPYNWIIEGFDFKKLRNTSMYSAYTSAAISTWALEMTSEQWALLSDKLFLVLDMAGVTNLNDFNDDIFGTLHKIKEASAKLDDDSKDKIKEIIDMFKSNATHILKQEAKLIADEM